MAEAIATPNVFNGLLNNTYVGIRLNLAEQETLAADPVALVDNIDLLLTHGTMSASTRAIILNAVRQIVPPAWAPQTPVGATPARLAIHLAMLSADYAILK